MRSWAAALALALWAMPAAAVARPRVAWSAVAVRDGGDAKRIGRQLDRLLKRATRRADWGKRKGALRLSARLTRCAWQEGDGVLRLELTLVGRIDGATGGAPEVRSRIRVGGHPSDKKKLERDGLRIVADGLVTRLADIARR